MLELLTGEMAASKGEAILLRPAKEGSRLKGGELSGEQPVTTAGSRMGGLITRDHYAYLGYRSTLLVVACLSLLD